MGDDRYRKRATTYASYSIERPYRQRRRVVCASSNKDTRIWNWASLHARDVSFEALQLREGPLEEID